MWLVSISFHRGFLSVTWFCSTWWAKAPSTERQNLRQSQSKWQVYLEDAVDCYFHVFFLVNTVCTHRKQSGKHRERKHVRHHGHHRQDGRHKREEKQAMEMQPLTSVSCQPNSNPERRIQPTVSALKTHSPERKPQGTVSFRTQHAIEKQTISPVSTLRTSRHQ